jgi:hypothetical protein
MIWLSPNKTENWIIGFLLVVAVLMVLAAVGYFTGRWEALGAPAKETNLYGDVPLDATLLQLDRRALDEAYHAQLLKLWGVWLADGARHPDNFQNGLGNARRAYGLALQAIVKREERQRRGEP